MSGNMHFLNPGDCKRPASFDPSLTETLIIKITDNPSYGNPKSRQSETTTMTDPTIPVTEDEVARLRRQ